MLIGKTTEIYKVVEYETQAANPQEGRGARYSQLLHPIDVILDNNTSYKANPDAWLKYGDIIVHFNTPQLLKNKYKISDGFYELVDYKETTNPLTYTTIYKGVLRKVV